jgi:hypothetical protein
MKERDENITETNKHKDTVLKFYLRAVTMATHTWN